MVLAPQRTNFFGRERERARLAELLAGAPLVTITGVGGVGKTRLAHEVTAAESGTPVYWCALTAVDDDADVPAAVATALGRERGPSVEAVVAAINERGGLLVLDNCEHVVRGAADLAEAVLAECPEPRLLCTSREPLNVEGEAVLALAELAPTDAIRMFVDRARLVRWDFELDDGNSAAVERVCTRLDGLPLALELAAARVGSLSPAEIAELLDERFSLLARPRAREGERHRTLRATVDWSYRLLDESEKQVFERLSVFASGWDLDAATAVCERDVLDTLLRLVERSLVRAEDGTAKTRYSMLETLRHYGRDRLQERGDADRAHALHADHFAKFTDAYRHDSEVTWDVAMLRAPQRAWEDVRAAAYWSMRQSNDRTTTLRLIAPLWALAHSRHSNEIAELCEEAMAAWPLEHDDLGQALIGSAAVANFVAGRPEMTQRLAAFAIRGEEAGGAPAVIARRALALTTYGFLGQVEAGLERLEEAVESAQLAEMPAVALEMAVLRVQALAASGRIDEALAQGEHARAEAERLGSLEMLAWGAYIHGTVLKAAGDDRAEACFVKAQQLADQIDFHLVQGVCRRQRAAIALRKGDRGEAAALFADAYEHFAATGDWPQAWDVLRGAAFLLERVGKGELAAQVLAGSHSDPRARQPAPLEVADIRQLAERLATELAVAEAAPSRVDDLGPAVLGELRALRSDDGRAPAAQPPQREEQHLFRLEGDLWTLSFEGQTVHLPDLKGLHDLARLLSEPGQEFHCLELSGAPRSGGGAAGEEGLGLQGHAGELLDTRAKAEFKQRILELREEADRAETAGDTVVAERAREELDKLTEALAAAFGLGGRARTAGDPAERARTAVAWRIRSSLSKIEAAHAPLARHLRNSVRTGVFCSYQPERPVSWVT